MGVGGDDDGKDVAVVLESVLEGEEESTFVFRLDMVDQPFCATSDVAVDDADGGDARRADDGDAPRGGRGEVKELRICVAAVSSDDPYGLAVGDVPGDACLLLP